MKKQITTKKEMVTLIRENEEILKPQNIVESFKLSDLNKLSFNQLRHICSVL